MNDPVNNPYHYTYGDTECIEIAENFSFCAGAALKYIWRHQYKGKPVEDLRKAAWFLRREIQRLENEEITNA